MNQFILHKLLYRRPYHRPSSKMVVKRKTIIKWKKNRLNVAFVIFAIRRMIATCYNVSTTIYNVSTYHNLVLNPSRRKSNSTRSGIQPRDIQQLLTKTVLISLIFLRGKRWKIRACAGVDASSWRHTRPSTYCLFSSMRHFRGLHLYNTSQRYQHYFLINMT